MSISPDTDPVGACAGCGASVFPEHLNRGLAGRMSGDLFCPHCLSEKKKADRATAGDRDLASLSLVDEPPTGDGNTRSSLIGYTGAGLAEELSFDHHSFQRPLNPGGRGATRVRIWHCKLANGPVNHLNHQINEWLDQNPDVEVKFANTTVGTWEGKHAEPNLIITLFY